MGTRVFYDIPLPLTNINIGDAIYRINEKFLTDLPPYSDKLPEPEVGSSESLLATNLIYFRSHLTGGKDPDH